MKLSHNDNGKGKFMSHEISILDEDFVNTKLGIFSHDITDLTGYGSTKEEAIEDFKNKYDYLLKELIAFGDMLFTTDTITNDIVEVDCFNKPI